MNWETAKTWLIAVFLLLDVLLGWQVVQSRNAMQGYVESATDVLADTKTLLAQHGFSLVTDVPTEHPNMSTMHADFANVNLKQLVKIAFTSTKKVTIHPGADASTNAGNIHFVGSGSWQVDYNQPMVLPADTGSHLIKQIWHHDEYTRDDAPDTPGIWTFVQKYQSYPVFDSTVTLDITKSKLTGYTQTALDKMTAVDTEKPIITALDALNSLAGTVDKSSDRQDNRILKIDLGYARKLSMTPTTTSPPAANYWFPVWRVVTDTQTYYINAFTGEVDTNP